MIRRAAEVVCGALALGGGALLKIAPPASTLTATNAVAINHGILAIVAALIYVIIVARINYTRIQIPSAKWQRAAIRLGIVGVVLLVAYVVCRPHFVVNVEGTEFLVGMWRDGEWAEFNPALANSDSQEVVDEISIENAYSDVWTEPSRMVSRLVFLSWYLVSGLMVLGALFCASESIVWVELRRRIVPKWLNGGGNSNH